MSKTANFNKKSVLFTLYRGTTRVIQLQLFVSLVSLPLLISWGLPFSLLTFVGNIIFSYALTAFLLVSTITFFFELLHIPNCILLWTLEYISSIWLTMLNSLSSSHWSIGFQRPSTTVLCLIPLIAFTLVHSKKLSRHLTTVLFITALAIGGCLKLITSDRSNTCTLPYQNKELKIVKKNNQTMVVDPGILSKSRTSDSWITYTLKPELIKTCGTQQINHYICLVCDTSSFYALGHLLNKLSIRKIYIPYWEEKEKSSLKRAYGFLMYRARETNTQIIRIPPKGLLISHGPDKNVTILPCNKKILKTGYSYDRFNVTA